MNHALLGLATNTALPPALLDRLIAVAVADDETADALATPLVAGLGSGVEP
ncbi:hypothetical protein [Streptomyces sp. NBC_00370]|uniref:hypothetical protein n=1 Tax=Streptomyces sp. NBC_00370 TaxID=2975728 RepID=UPI002E2592C7